MSCLISVSQRLETAHAWLTNYEVLQIIQEQQEKRKLCRKTQLPNLLTVEFEVLQYLQKTPCVDDSQEHIQHLQTSLKLFPLTPLERLHLINWKPQQLVELCCMLRNGREFLSEVDMNTLIEHIHHNRSS
jgi:hypothetical protein